MMGRIKNKILQTILYADLFDYPLTIDEIWRYLHSDKKTTRSELKKELSVLKKISKKENFYLLKGREGIVEKRIAKQKESERKIIRAKKVINMLSLVPTVKLIGISGSLSVLNSKANDDIDLFVIASSGKIWTTRFLLVLFLLMLGSYRRRGLKKTKDLFCLNMIIDESNFFFTKDKKNIYTAHEIAQLLPIVNKDRAYQNFIKKNSWIFNFMANFDPPKIRTKKQASLEKIFNSLINLFVFEKIAKTIQIALMKKRLGKEITRDDVLAFHPYDFGQKIIEKYESIITYTRGH